ACAAARASDSRWSASPVDLWAVPARRSSDLAGECDIAETCTGTSTSCPAEVLKASGTACTDDGNVCSRDICSGSGATCTHPAGNAGTVCRSATDECDIAETCTGTSTFCPAEVLKASGTACTDRSEERRVGKSGELGGRWSMNT